MLLAQYIFVNSHFVISIFAALVFFAVFWLYFDAWLVKKDYKEGLIVAGLLAISISFLAQATIIEQSLLEHSLLTQNITLGIRAIFRILGYLLLIFGQLSTPLQPLPSYRTEKTTKNQAAIIFPLLGIPISQLAPFLFPILAVLVAYVYLKRATVGLEHHLKPIALGFFVLAVYELLGLSSFFRGTSDVTLLKIVAPFGLLWFAERAVLLVSVFIIGKWVWGYLLKRFENQLFMIITSITLSIFLLTTIFFTYATLNNLKEDVLASLKTDVGVLAYTIESKKAEILSDTQVVAQNSQVIAALVGEDKAALSELVTASLLAKKESSLIVVSPEGAVLVNAEDPERVGHSLSDNPLIQRALLGESITGITVKEGVVAPIVNVEAAVPITEAGKTLGAIRISVGIDSAFVDGVKKATGLDASVYADNIRSATTFVTADGKSRWIGITEENKEVKDKVLTKGEVFAGSVNILNVPYFAAYSPLVDVNQNPIGMLFVGRPEVSLLQTASRSIELTFITTAILLVLSIGPAFLISKYIANQVR
jgi:hypothetical protein